MRTSQNRSGALGNVRRQHAAVVCARFAAPASLPRCRRQHQHQRQEQAGRSAWRHAGHRCALAARANSSSISGAVADGEEEAPHRALDPNQLARLARFLGRGAPPPEDGGGDDGPAAPPVRIGLIGASNVATYAAIWPARRARGVEVAGVAARDPARAAQYARTHGLPRAYASYAALLDDPAIDAVYVGLPNGLHGRWAAAALAAGKHVLCEKPLAANQREARRLFDAAAAAGRLCREAFHNAYHPANRRLRGLLLGGVIGELVSVSAEVLIPSYAFSARDIRFSRALAGGCMMDAGCYCAHALRFFTGREPAAVVSAEPLGPLIDGCDAGMGASVVFGPDSSGGGQPLTGSLRANLRHSGPFPVTRFEAHGTRGTASLDNFVVPFFGHKLTVSAASEPDGPRETRAVSVYGSGEANYYWQLREFVRDVATLKRAAAQGEAGGSGGGGTQQRTAAQVWAEQEARARDSVANQELIDAVYAAAGLEPREPTEVWW